MLMTFVALIYAYFSQLLFLSDSPFYTKYLGLPYNIDMPYYTLFDSKLYLNYLV